MAHEILDRASTTTTLSLYRYLLPGVLDRYANLLDPVTGRPVRPQGPEDNEDSDGASEPSTRSLTLPLNAQLAQQFDSRGSLMHLSDSVGQQSNRRHHEHVHPIGYRHQQGPPMNRNNSPGTRPPFISMPINGSRPPMKATTVHHGPRFLPRRRMPLPEV